MRIQHNIMAMNAYRNYNTNVAAMKSNLEKLSSGYKINRAGDDAAGLAISEKMRAQITGLNAAQKNVKDGISLVQTAEGAMQEVQDMLNRMVYLATQSANGTYDDEVDRNNLQKELDQLRSEIDRISDSSNFNGIKLLDGSKDAGGVATKIDGMDRILEGSTGKATGTGVADVGTKTILDGAAAAEDVKTEFVVDFTGMTVKTGGTTGGNAGAKAKYSFDLSGVTADAANLNTKTIDGQALTFTTDLNGTMNKFVTDYNADNTKTYTASWDATAKKVTLEAKAVGAVAAAPTTTLTGTTTTPATKDVWTATLTLSGGFAVGDTVTKADGTSLTVVADTDTPTAGQIKQADADALTIDDLQVTIPTGATKAGYTVTGGGTKTVTFTADNAGAVGGATGPADAPVAGDLTAPTAMGSRTFTWTMTNTTVGAEATTTGGAAITANADVAGADPVPGTAVEQKITLKLNGTAIVTDLDLAGKESADEIADAVLEQITADGNNSSLDIGNGTATYTVTKDGTGKLKFALNEDPTTANIKGNFTWDITAGADNINGAHTGGTKVTKAGSVASTPLGANTVFEIKQSDLTDGTKITLNGTTVTLAVGKDSTLSGTGVVDLKDFEAGSVDIDIALGRISQAMGDTKNFIVGVNNAGLDSTKGLTVQSKGGTNFDTMEKLAAEFSISTKSAVDESKALTFQIGDTADDYNQLKVSIGDIHTKALKIDGISIETQAGAAEAVQKIKDAINRVSSIRGDLGATQNRLEHTQNNLSVMTENIQDAESTIRDTDVAEEMMAYTKNNILIQAAQAMLAQANQVPQGVLQLLQ